MRPAPVAYRTVQREVVSSDRHLSVLLPPDTIAEGVRRLGWLALVYSIGHIAGPFARLVLSAVRGTVDSWEFGIPDAFGLGAVIMGFTMFAVVRRGVQSSRRLLDLGLVFQVAGALGLAVREFWHGLPQTAGGSFLVPGECVWLVAYPILVPNTEAAVCTGEPPSDPTAYRTGRIAATRPSRTTCRCTSKHQVNHRTIRRAWTPSSTPISAVFRAARSTRIWTLISSTGWATSSGA
jgi:hypothetical protein